MQLTSVLISLAAIAPLAQANFDIYAADFVNAFDGSIRRGWQIFDTDPSCAQVDQAIEFGNQGDVSGNKRGVRCKGECFGEGSPSKIDELEMHFSNDPLYHMTIYKNRGYRMYGLDGTEYGECITFPSNRYSCPYAVGNRKFRCLTKKTAKEITGKN